MKIKFTLNKYYILAHALDQFTVPFPAWTKILDDFWDNYPLGAYLLTNHSEAIFSKKNSISGLNDATKELKIFFNKVLKSREFNRLYLETERYMKVIDKQWQRNRKEALSILSKVSGLSLPDKDTTVLITHPKLRNGVNFSQFNVIGWGHSEDWKNYTTVYLCHELLHIMVSGKSKHHNVMHALIELATDNELRIRLNKKGKYFKEEGIDIGHPGLRDLENKLLPIWRNYLKSSRGQTIIDLANNIKDKS